MKTSGSATLTPTDTAVPAITGTSAPVTVRAALASHFLVTAPATADAGEVLTFTVAALDVYGNTDAAYPGTVHFTSSDPLALLPADTALTDGTATVSATYRSGGNQTLTATDTVTVPAATGTSPATAVNTAPVITGQAALTATVGQPLTLTLADFTITDGQTPDLTGFTLSIADGAGYTHSGNTITPAADATGPLTVSVTVNDGSLDSAPFAATVALNHAPVPKPDTLGTGQNTPAMVIARKFALNDRDPDGDSLSVTAVSPSSARGGSVTLILGTITYIPAADFAGADSFTYTVKDTHGGVAEGTVDVTVTDAGAISRNSSIERTADGYALRFAGIPGNRYIIEYSSELDRGWAPLTGPVTADGQGIIDYTDNPQPAPPRRFYRTVAAP